MFLEKIKHIKAFILDVDGVLTDGKVLVTDTGEQLRRFNIKDGYALQLAVKRGYQVAALSGARSRGVELRLKGLGISHIYLGLDSKAGAYGDFLKAGRLLPEQVLYMGDDIPDVPVMKLCGLPVCPADAVEEVKALADYISPFRGGEGCVRDALEKVMKIRGDWHDEYPLAADGSLK